MNYLFVDVKKSSKNAYEAKLCIMAYKLFNEKMEEIEKNILTINPQVDFDEKVLNSLPFEKKTFDESKVFGDYYEDLKKVFEQENLVVILRNAYYDAKLIKEECDKLSRMPFIYKFYDFDEIYKAYLKVGDKFTKNETVIPEIINDDDLLLNLDNLKDILVAIKDRFEISFDELLNLDKNAEGQMSELDGFVSFRRTKDVANKENIFNSNLNKNSNYRVFTRFIDMYPVKEEDNLPLKDKKICISQNYESENFIQMINLVKMIKDNGGEYTDKVKNCNIFVKVDIKNEKGKIKRCNRLNDVEKEKELGNAIEVIELSTLLEKMNLTQEMLNEMELPELEFLFERKQPVKKVYKKVIRNFRRI